MSDQKRTVLSAQGIVKVFTAPFRHTILNGVDLNVGEGESLAVMGRSGEGKSTLLNILGTLDTATQGKLEILGEPVTMWNKAKLRSKNLGFVFQAFHLMNDFTVFENIAMPARIARKPCGPGTKLYQYLQHLLEQVGLADRQDQLAKMLSGGEKQRVAIARALCNDPDILFADEPSGNLDQQTADEIHQLLLDFTTKHNKTLVVVTHNEALAKLCARRCRIEDGSIMEA